MSVELADVLRQLEREKRTGVLRVGDGAFHLSDGAVTAAACDRTTGLERLVVETDVASAEDWRRAESGDPTTLLNHPRLTVLALLAVFDATYFLLALPTVAKFRPTPPHWLAPVCRITPGALVHEVERRGDPSAGPWPAAWVDRHPIVPVRHVRRRRVVLTAGQTEVLSAADTRRHITGIAHDLGRTTYGCLTAVRELTASGLIEPPVIVPGPVNGQAVRDDPATPGPATPGPGPPLRRRVPSTAPVAAGDRWEPVDRDVLLRLRTALEELA
ncbi:DUF4388 domain-containing protein [Nocardia mexicana]|uniref:MarR family transcriptional regulator n=1 Tax=Nocardia mexicana TaxID=279262 RepID=A0A370H8I3_9NOCA|nr:DUF4388 domain-containing protein [Nocardia mexicana]RDI52951.1 hypothetical protein DFR68_103339 [Nocardia mexicana]